jgi:CspA family cold shock protein
VALTTAVVVEYVAPDEARLGGFVRDSADIGQRANVKGPPYRRRDVQCEWLDQTRERGMTGKIRTLRVDKGFGFIKDDRGNDYFFHQSAIYGEGIADLREGDSVEFEVGQGPKGPRAENVRRTST